MAFKKKEVDNLQEKRKPQYNWKAVDNATITSTIQALGKTDDTAIDSTVNDSLASTKATDTQLERKAGSVKIVTSDSSALRDQGSLQGSGGVQKRAQNLNDPNPLGKKAMLDGRKKNVVRRQTAEGVRNRPRHNRMSARRASHSVIRGQGV